MKKSFASVGLILLFSLVAYGTSSETPEALYQKANAFQYQPEGGAPNYAAAFPLYKMSASIGYPPAQFELALLYYRGKGVAQDYSIAMALLRQAAEKHYLEAYYYLGIFYYYGKGIPPDFKKASIWFNRAADKGHTASQYYLGVMYYQGKGGPTDYAKAFEWFSKAAAKDYPEAQYYVGLMYEQGKHLPQNKDEALRWYQKAAAGNDPTAKQRLQQLQLTKKEKATEMLVPTKTPPVVAAKPITPPSPVIEIKPEVPAAAPPHRKINRPKFGSSLFYNSKKKRFVQKNLLLCPVETVRHPNRNTVMTIVVFEMQIWHQWISNEPLSVGLTLLRLTSRVLIYKVLISKELDCLKPISSKPISWKCRRMVRRCRMPIWKRSVDENLVSKTHYSMAPSSIDRISMDPIFKKLTSVVLFWLMPILTEPI